MTIRWTATAAADLENIYSFIQLDNQDSAFDIVLELYEAVERLATYPHLGRPSGDGFPKGSRRLSKPPFVIFYRVGEGAVSIDAIFHGSRRY